MTAFLFIPSVHQVGRGRRVDLANFASLFGDRDEPPVPPPTKVAATHLMLVTLLIIGMIGDAILVAGPDVLGSFVAGSPSAAKKLGRGISF